MAPARIHEELVARNVEEEILTEVVKSDAPWIGNPKLCVAS